MSLSGNFQQLEEPTRYYNSNGVSFGFVVRVQGFIRSIYLNSLCGMQTDLMTQTQGPGNSFYINTALFKTVGEAHTAAAKYYEAWHQPYGFATDKDGVWYPYGTTLNPVYILGTVESEVMRFE